MAKIDRGILVGKKFGRWTVLKVIDQLKLLCKCDCGTERPVLLYHLKYGRSTSCGCYAKENLAKHSRMHHKSEDTKKMVKHNEHGYKGVFFNGSSYGVKMSFAGFSTPEKAHKLYVKLKEAAREIDGK